MRKREETIRLWFDMWLQKTDLGIENIFTPDVHYVESWGPEYHGSGTVKHWFREWNTRGTVLQWDIKQFFHKDDQTVVEWVFRNRMDNGTVEAFEGLSLVVWSADNRICLLKEFGCNENRYNPYQDSETPRFRNEAAMWF